MSGGVPQIAGNQALLSELIQMRLGNHLPHALLLHGETGCGKSTDGIEQTSGFDITPASEIMAILCLARDVDDLRRRIDNILLGITGDEKPFFVKDLHIGGSIVALLLEAFNPNLVQTLEHTPAFIHGGPFANIAHGCNSVLATELSMTYCDYVVTEAGFGSDTKVCDEIQRVFNSELEKDPAHQGLFGITYYLFKKRIPYHIHEPYRKDMINGTIEISLFKMN